jgi:hypothetical protein
MTEDSNDLGNVLQELISALQRLSPDDRERIYETVGTFFDLRRSTRARFPSGLDIDSVSPANSDQSYAGTSTFSEDRSISPKQFLAQKQPRTDVERVACLAYYLTHYRDMPHFKTLDVSKLNTEAAQLKFANPTVAVNNASLRGYLVPSSKGAKQVSAFGERFVEALPDRDAAKNVMSQAAASRRRPRKKRMPAIA